MRSLLLAALLAAGPAMAQEMVTRHESDEVRITQKACPPNVLAMIPEGNRGVFRKALVLFQGKEHIACWALRNDWFVFLQYADGDAGLIPMVAFALVPDA